MKTTNGYRGLVFIILAPLILGMTPCQAAVVPTILHPFTARDAANLDGAHPMDLLYDDGIFYGLTFAGGQFDNGLIFSVNPDGANYKVIHTFDGIDGQNPSHTMPLLFSGQTLYGINRAGFAYAIKIDGSNYHHVHDFGDPNSGYQPDGALTLSGDTLFGVTTVGGPNDNGAIYAVSTNGENYHVLYYFSSYDPTILTNIDGARPNSGLSLDGNVLYGATQFGGKGSGTIFKINTDGSDYTILHTFAPAVPPNQIPSKNTDGMYIEGKLILYSGKLYGVTRWGGSSGNGVFFSLNTDGSGFKLIYTFPGQADITVGDPGPLTLASQTIYGTRPAGGATARVSFLNMTSPVRPSKQPTASAR